MLSNPYLQKKMLAERHANIQRTMQKSHRQAPATQQHIPTQNAVNRFGTLLIAFGYRLQRSGQPGKAYL